MKKKFNSIFYGVIVVTCGIVMVSSIMESPYLKKMETNCMDLENRDLKDAFETQYNETHFFKYVGFTWTGDGEKRYNYGFTVNQSVLSALFDGDKRRRIFCRHGGI